MGMQSCGDGGEVLEWWERGDVLSDGFRDGKRYGMVGWSDGIE